MLLTVGRVVTSYYPPPSTYLLAVRIRVAETSDVFCARVSGD